MFLLENTLTEHLQLLGVGVLFAWFIFWIAWNQGFYRFPLHKSSSEEWIAFIEVFGAFIIFLTATLIVAPLVALLWLSYQTGHFIEMNHHSIDPTMHGWLNAATIVISAASVLLYSLLLPPQTQSAVWGSRAFSGITRTVQDIMTGMAAWLISYPLVVIIGQVVAVISIYIFHHEPSHIDQVAVKYLKSTMSDPFLFGVTVTLIIFVVPLLEEILFRGFLQTWLKQHLGILYAIVTTSIIFALFHFSITQGWDNVELLLSLFVLSCFLGFLRERQRSLWASIGLHATFNAVTVLAILLMRE